MRHRGRYIISSMGSWEKGLYPEILEKLFFSCIEKKTSKEYRVCKFYQGNRVPQIVKTAYASEEDLRILTEEIFSRGDKVAFVLKNDECVAIIGYKEEYFEDSESEDVGPEDAE